MSEKAGPIEGVVDTGVVAVAHFKNPARETAFNFLSSILRWERRCITPTSAFIGAYHIMTEYIGVDKVSAYRALSKTLETRSPALHEDISIDVAVDSLSYANGYKIESWDGYVVSLAKSYGAPVIYTLDQEMARKVKEIAVVNPIQQEAFRQYNEWLAEKLGRKGDEQK
ncbi:MAG: type II toxin-antitoxin system VapC family toxin [Candidatus Bathyarchaeia archaeon]